MSEESPASPESLSDIPPPPSPPPSEPPLSSGTPGTAATDSGLEPTIAAGLCAIFPLVAGIIFLVIEKKNQYVRFYAMQSLLFGVFGIAVRIGLIVLGILPFVKILLIPVWLVFGLIMLAIYIIQIIKAFSGVEWEIPVLGPIARQQIRKNTF